MSIPISSCPHGALDVLIDGLINFEAFDDDAPGVITFANITGDLPLPVLILDARAAAAHELTPAASTWRYFFDMDGKPMFADLGIEENGQLAFKSTTVGRVAEFLRDGFSGVEDFAETEPERVLLQIIEIPALNEVAVWLRGRDREWIFEVLRRGQLGPMKVLEASEYFSRVSEDVERS